MLTSILLVVNVPLVTAIDNIRIRPDGVVEGTTSIQQDGNSYTFTGNIVGTIRIEKSGITIDGNGFTLSGDGTNHGFYLPSANDTIIRNVRVENCNNGFYLLKTSNNTITDNIVTNNNVGIYISTSLNTIVTENEVYNNEVATGGYGINLVSSNGGIVSNNEVYSNYLGIRLLTSQNNIVTGNNVYSNEHDAIYSRTCTNDVISDNTLSDNGEGGIVLAYSPADYQIINNRILDNGLNGIQMEYATNITVKENHIENNGKNGIRAFESTDVVISQNNITENQVDGVYLQAGSNGNMIFLNNITSNTEYGINFDTNSEDNMVYYNNFINNGGQAANYPDHPNIWYSLSPIGGNYWSDYDGQDNNQDGIGDTPYIIDESNQDNYPLMNKIPEFPSWMLLPLFLTATIAAIIYRNSLRRKTKN